MFEDIFSRLSSDIELVVWTLEADNSSYMNPLTKSVDYVEQHGQNFWKKT